MASSTQLVTGLAAELGLGESTLALHFRLIREAGYITQGGRGRSAARMTASDAAHLLIASMGSLHPKDATDMIEIFADLPRTKKENWSSGLCLAMDSASSLATFHEAITSLIQSAVDGKLILEKPEDVVLVTMLWPSFLSRVEFYTPDKTSGRPRYSEPLRLTYGELLRPSPHGLPYVPLDEIDGGLQVERKINHRTIFAIAEILKG